MEKFILYVRLGFVVFIVLIIVWLAWVIIPLIKGRKRKREKKEKPELRRFIFLAEGDGVREVRELSPDENIDKAMEECGKKYGDELYYIEDTDRTEAAYKLLNRLKRRTLF